MPRGRPKKTSDPCVSGEAGTSAGPSPVPASALSSSPEVSAESRAYLELDIPGLPPSKIKGQWNPEYFSCLLDFANKRYIQQTIIDGGTSQFNYSQFQKGVMDAAKLVGITERDIIDRRTEAQRASDAIERLLGDPEAIFGSTDEDLEAIDRVIQLKTKRMDDADQGVYEVLDGYLRDEEEGRIRDMRTPKEMNLGPRTLQAWRLRIRRVLRLRQRVKHKVPPGGNVGNQWTEHPEAERPGLKRQAIEAAHPARYMIYVGRSGMDQSEQFEVKKVDDPCDLIFDIGPHHCRFYADLWMHRNGVAMKWDREHLRSYYQPGIIPYDGSIQVMAIGHGKPLDIETIVTMGNGHQKRLGDIVVGDMVMTHEGRPRRVSEVHEQGELETVRISTASRRSVISALEHPFLTTHGWTRARDLVAGDYLAILSGGEFDVAGGDKDECRLAGYFVGDGHTAFVSNGKGIAANITCADPATAQEITRCAESMGFSVYVTKPTSSKASRYAFSEGTSQPRPWLHKIGVAGKKSIDKEVPDFVFGCSNECVAEFLASYFECDGSVTKSSTREKFDLAVEYYSISRKLLEQVSFLLLRFGIKSRISSKWGKYKGEKHQSYRLSITSGDETAKFAARIPVKGPKGERLAALSRKRSTFDSLYLTDKVEEVAPNGLRPCRCLTVEDDHTFLANDFVVHNTEIAIHYAGLEIGLRPRTQGIYLHARADESIKNLAAIKRFVNPRDGIGQRHLSLFPSKLTASQNDAHRMRLDVKNPPKSPTFTAASTDMKALGADGDFQIWDDVVPQSDAERPTERKRRASLLSGTFASRKRSRKAFTLVIGTLWHYDDALMNMINQAKLAARTNGQQGIMYGVNIQRCGGPKEKHGVPAWKSLWPKQYDVFRLKKKYHELGASLYAAAMMADPMTDEQRIVKRLRLYDPLDQSGEHASFLKSSRKYISLDPAATKNRDSDKAGIVYAGMGDVRTEVENDGVKTIKMETRIRLFNCHEIYATQSDLTEYVLNFAKYQEVDYVLVEAIGGFKGIVEMFEGLGIDAIPMTTKGKDKESRLRGVAPAIDDICANLGFRAVVEWPGVWEGEGEMRRLVLHPMFKGLAEQVLDFGVCANDHMLDGLTYLVGYLAPELSIGRGIITEQVKRVQQEVGDPRLLAMYKSYERSEKLRNAATSEEFEQEWMKQQWQ